MKKSITVLLLFFTIIASAQNTYYKFPDGSIFNQSTFDIIKEKMQEKGNKTEEILTKRVVKKDSIIKTIIVYSDVIKDENGNYVDLHFDLNQKIGTHFPIENFKNSKGENFNENAFNGKASFINFWFTACAPCIKEIPYLNSLKKRFGTEVNFIAITFNTKIEVARFLEEKKLNFVHIADSRKQIKNLGISSYPTSILLDPKGNIQKVYGILRPSLKKEIENYLKNHSSTNIKK